MARRRHDADRGVRDATRGDGRVRAGARHARRDCDDWRRPAHDVPGLALALDTGHCIVTGGWEPDAAVREFAPHLGAVAVEDMPRGRHEHRAPGEGDMDLPAVLAALADVGYARLVSLELPRDAHRADTLVPAALAALRAAERERVPA